MSFGPDEKRAHEGKHDECKENNDADCHNDRKEAGGMDDGDDQC